MLDSQRSWSSSTGPAAFLIPFLQTTQPISHNHQAQLALLQRALVPIRLRLALCDSAVALTTSVHL